MSSILVVSYYLVILDHEAIFLLTQRSPLPEYIFLVYHVGIYELLAALYERFVF